MATAAAAKPNVSTWKSSVIGSRSDQLLKRSDLVFD